MSPSRDPDLVPSPGTLVADKYLLEDEIGRGGMGVVFRARNQDNGEAVAVKMLQPGAAIRPRIVERFRREVRAATAIVSEHVAKVYDVGVHDERTPFMVMEYLEGEDLAAALKRGPVSPATAVAYALQACDALEDAHARGIIHRDLKPGNVFLAKRPGGSTQVKLLDFGVSKILTDDSLTNTNAVVGSPMYMAPEQMVSSKHVDARADVWALGAIVFEMLAGQTPFSADSIPQLLNQLLYVEPRSLSELNPRVPPELDEVLRRCLAANRDDRFDDVAALRAVLAPFSAPPAEPIVDEFSADDVTRAMPPLDRPAPPLPAPPLPAPPLPSAPMASDSSDTEIWEDKTVARPVLSTDFDEPDGTAVMSNPAREAAIDAIVKGRQVAAPARPGSDHLPTHSAPSPPHSAPSPPHSVPSPPQKGSSALSFLIVTVVAFFAGAVVVGLISLSASEQSGRSATSAPTGTNAARRSASVRAAASVSASASASASVPSATARPAKSH